MGKRKRKRKVKKQKDILKTSEIIEYCEKHNMKAHFTVNILFVTTPFGEWYIPLDEYPIKLFHKNPKAANVYNVRKSLRNQYHNQERRFETYYLALSYIYTHDFNKVKRDNIQAREKDVFKILKDKK